MKRLAPAPSGRKPLAARADAATLAATATLAGLTGQVEAMRAVLIRLAQDLVVARRSPPASASTELIEANAHLQAEILQSRAEAANADRARDALQRSSQLDPLTQLPLRALLLDRFEQAIAGAQRRGERLALLFLDLDDFKHINDSLGHTAGDTVLQQVAQRLHSSVRAVDTVSRHGGDEFLVLLAEVAQAQDASVIAAKLRAAVGEPLRVGEHLLHLGVSIGISLYPEDGDSALTLIDRADAAMYAAKRQGHGNPAFHAASAMLPTPSTGPDIGIERRHAELREANEHLVLAALGAQSLQAAAEAAQQRQAAFVAAVAQELRNPLAPIRIATAMLGQPGVDEALMPRVQSLVSEQMAQMSRLVGDLLDPDRPDGGPMALHRRRVDLVGIIAGCVSASRPLIDARHQVLDAALPSHALSIDGDPDRLAQIVGNLLDNASKHTHDGGHIVLTARVSDDRATVAISIADDGIGIAPSTLPLLFDPFMQDLQALGLHGVGLGIGLTVVRSLVEAHGGHITANSAGTGLGSLFVVSLPLLAPDPATPSGDAHTAGRTV